MEVWVSSGWIEADEVLPSPRLKGEVILTFIPNMRNFKLRSHLTNILSSGLQEGRLMFEWISILSFFISTKVEKYSLSGSRVYSLLD